MRTISTQQQKNIKHVLHVDSHGLYDTITTLHNGRESRIRQTFQRIRDFFEAGGIDILRWVPSAASLADVLTKRNKEAQKKTNKVIQTTKLDLSICETVQLHSDSWRRHSKKGLAAYGGVFEIQFA